MAVTDAREIEVPEELALAARLELGVAALDEVQAYVDRRVLAVARVTGPLLELCDLRTLSPECIAWKLESLSTAEGWTRAAWLAVASARACESGAVSLERASAYLMQGIERLGDDGDLVYGVADALDLATSGTYGTREDALERMRELERHLLARLR
jgi:hypothetical protein